MKEIKQHKADWLRSEIEKLEGMKQEIPPYKENDHLTRDELLMRIAYNTVLTFIITRYKEELLELEKEV